MVATCAPEEEEEEEERRQCGPGPHYPLFAHARDDAASQHVATPPHPLRHFTMAEQVDVGSKFETKAFLVRGGLRKLRIVPRGEAEEGAAGGVWVTAPLLGPHWQGPRHDGGSIDRSCMVQHARRRSPAVQPACLS